MNSLLLSRLLIMVASVILYLPCRTLGSLGLSADVGSAIIGVVTPDEVFLFTDSARSTITPTPGATPELIDTRTMKLWKTPRLIWAQAGVQTISVRDQRFDFREQARRMLTANTRFDPVEFRGAWLPEVENQLRGAFDDDPANFENLVKNGMKGVEIVIGWFDDTGEPHIGRIHVTIRISPLGALTFENQYSEIHPTEPGKAPVMLAAEAADIAPELMADRYTSSQIETKMSKGLYAEAAKIIIDYTGKRFSGVGGAIQAASLRRAELK